MILGTAGHIDHGKTALVRALTGVDTDRLPEEKRRGITIDLGFAPLRLDTGQVLGVVDVPGHEAFVRTMLAGASGIDVALLVIAADEGPMPQTREHLAILELLDVRSVIVALTKCDLVDDEWLELVTEEVRELLKTTPFAESQIVPTSVVTSAGIDRLRAAIAERFQLPAPDSRLQAPFRLPIDRVFTVKGTGTVVTGTVWSGQLTPDDTVHIMPDGAPARVRSLQNHGQSVTRLTPGMRAAVALAGVDAQAVARGASIVSGHWHPSLVLRADVTLLPDAAELRPRTRVRFHLATVDVGARVVATGTPMSGGASRPVRVVLDAPVIARAGDRFVLRSASPLATIGGGVITDPTSPRRARPMKQTGLTPAARLVLFAEESGLHGVPVASVPIRAGVDSNAVAVLATEAHVTRLGESLYATAAIDAACDRLVALVTAHHKQHPLDTGAPRQDIRSRLGIDSELFDTLVSRISQTGRLQATGAELRTPGWGPALSDKQRTVSDELVSVLSSAGHEPPSVSELQERFGSQTASLLRHLERERRVVQVEDGRYYAPEAVTELLRRLETGMTGRGALAPTDLKEVLGFSRKFLIPFLEYCDKRGYTLRQGNGRVWRGVAVRSAQEKTAVQP